MTKKYVVALGLIAALSIAAYLTLHKIVVSQKNSAFIINVSGKQRYISQLIEIQALRLVNTKDGNERKMLRQKLLHSIDLMEENHNWLTRNNRMNNLTVNLSPQIYKMYFKPPINLDNQIRDYVNEVKALAHDKVKALTQDNTHLKYIISVASSRLLNSLDSVVEQFQKESEETNTRLQHVESGVLGITIFVLVLEVILIFRPMVSSINEKSDKLIKSETRTRLLIDYAMDGIIMINEQDIIELFNPAAEKIFGYASAYVIGKNIQLIIPEVYFEILCNSMMSGLKLNTFELKAQRKDGTLFPLEVSPSTLYIDDRQLFVIIVRDISERKRSEEALKRRSDFISAILNTTNALIVVLDKSGCIVSVNRAFEKTILYSCEEIRGKSLWDGFLLPEEAKQTKTYFTNFCNDRFPEEHEQYWRTKDGGLQLIAWSNSIISNSEGTVEYIVSTGINITRQKKIEERLQMLSQAIEQSPTTVVITDIKGNIEYVNPKFSKLTGYIREEAIGKNPRILKSGKTPPEEYKILWETITSGKEWRGEFHNKKKNGESYWEFASISPIKNTEGVITHFLGIKEDITDRKNFEVKLAYLAHHDPLTNFFNRRRFQEELNQLFAQVQRYEIQGALLFLDIDNFKYVNDSLGHQMGDELLVIIAGILKKQVRETDTIARLGGDEFAIVLSHVDAYQAQIIAGKILGSIRQYAILPSKQSNDITVSIGIALFPQHGNTPETLVTFADLAMYQAKEKGRNCFCVYEKEHKTKMDSQLSWKSRIRKAIDQDRFILHLQPIFDLQYNCIVGYESLLRMVGDNEELIYPAEFLHVAEHFDLIGEIDRWVVKNAIRLIAEINTSNKNQYVGVNLSGRSFEDSDLLFHIKNELESNPINPANMVLEITENIVISNLAQAESFITALKTLGCRFALDDFGIGFSSFSYLKHLSVDYLKIDGSFIQNLPKDRIDQNLVKAIVEVARVLNKQTIAEFVGCKETVQLLMEIGVDYAQGYYLSHPLAVVS